MVMNVPRKGGRRAPLENPIKIAVPDENDILCGKDRSCALHKGSQKFRTVIDSYRGLYLKATTKYDKMQITKEIYEFFLARNSRFLKYNDKEKMWEEIAPLAARDKVGHALRFANQAGHNKKQTKSKMKKLKNSPLMALQQLQPELNNLNLNFLEQPEHRREGSFSSGSDGSDSNGNNPISSTRSLPGTTTTNAELVANLVEVAKEEPQVWDSVVDHLNSTYQPEYQGSACSSAYHNHQDYDHYGMAPVPSLGPPSQAVNDPCALENIAYAVDTGTEDALLDGLVNLLNNDAETEEYIQDVLNQAAHNSSQNSSSNNYNDVPPSIDVSSSMPSIMTSAIPEEQASSHPLMAVSATKSHLRRTSSLPNMLDVGGGNRHHRDYSDGMWSVMQEPLMDLDWR